MSDALGHVDTSDHRLARHDLRLRGSALTEGGWLWVLELPTAVGKASFASTDLVWPAPGPEVPAPATKVLAGVTGGRPLVPAGELLPPPGGSARDRLRPASTVAQVVEASLTDSRRWLVAQDVGLRTAEHPEFVHQARVATRTLRSDLRTFRPLLDRRRVQELRGELKWLAAALGEVRDLDVLEERLRARADEVDRQADHRAAGGATALHARLRLARQAASADLRVLLDTDRYLHLLAALEEPLPWAPEADPAAPAAPVVGRLVRKPWRRLSRAVAALPDDPSDTELHRVRLRAKQVRYAATAVAPAAGPPAERLAKRAKALQAVLGDHQDAVEGRTWLEAAMAGADPDEAWFAGQRALLDNVERLEARAAWPAVWARLDRRSLRRWLHR